jgi:hypothetical protein
MIATDAVPKDQAQEAVMGHAIPAQHAPVVLRSRFNRLRALLAIALVCVAGLIVAIVSVTSDNDQVAGQPAQSFGDAGFEAVNPSTGHPSGDVRPQGPRTGYYAPVERFDGGPSTAHPSAGVRAKASGTRIDEGVFSPPSGILSPAGPRAKVPSPGYDGGPVERYEAETKYFTGPVDR